MFTNPSLYKKKIENTNIGFFLQLEQLDKNMKNYNLNPDYEQYRKKYQQSLDTIHENDLNLLSIKNSLEKDSNNIKLHIREENNKIDELEIENDILEKKTNSMKDGKLTSEELKKDFSRIYNNRAIQLGGYSILVIGLGVMLYRHFRSSN